MFDPAILENFDWFMIQRANEIETLKPLLCQTINDISMLQVNNQEIDRNIKVFQAYIQMDSMNDMVTQDDNATANS